MEQSNEQETKTSEHSDERERKIRLRKQVLSEIISSEEAYISQLDLLLNGFLRPVREKNLLPKNSFSKIFGDIEPLYTLNLTFQEELLKEENVGTAFLKIAPYLKIYATYAHDYELAITSLQDLRKSNKEFEAFVSQQERLPHITRKLEALLIVPIQRVPRYRLLLTELINHTEESVEEHTILRAALQQIESVARHINEQIRDQENMQRMIRIQKSLAHSKPKIITPCRRFIKEGSLKKVSSDHPSSAHQRYFILFNDMMLYCKVRNNCEPSQKSSLICSCVLPLRHCRAEAVMGDGLFKVTCRDETLLLCSNTAEDGKHWVEAINTAAQQLEANLRTLRKESSSRRPMRNRQLKQNDSLMRKFTQRRTIASKRPASQFLDVEIMRSEHENTEPEPSTPKKSSSRNTIKMPKWPASCPGTPSITYSPRKFLALKAQSTPVASPAQETCSPMFCSPPIQIDFVD